MAKKAAEQDEAPSVDEVEAMLDGGDDMVIGIDDELDLEGEGFQARRIRVRVQDVDIQHKDNGDLAIVTFASTVEGELPYPIRATFWTRHNNPEAQRIGKGGIKRLFKAAFGEPRGSLAALRGVELEAWVREDDSGRLTPSSFRAVKAEEQTEPVEL